MAALLPPSSLTTRPRPLLSDRLPVEEPTTDRAIVPSGFRPQRRTGASTPLSALTAAGLGPGRGLWRTAQNNAAIQAVGGIKTDLGRDIVYGHARRAKGGGWIGQGLNGYKLWDANGNLLEEGSGQRGDLYDQAAQDAFQSSLLGGAGGGAGGPGGGGGVGGEGAPGDLNSDISAGIRRLISGKDAPYGQDAIDRLKSSAYEDAAAGAESNKRAVAQRAQRTGGLYSASAGSAAAEADRSARSDFSQAARGIEQAATEKNFDARMQGMTQGLALLQQERDERMANARNEVERESIAKQYQGLIESTRMKIQSDERMASQANAAAGAAGSAGRDFQREMSALEWERELDRRRYEEPWRLAQLGGGLLGGD